MISQSDHTAENRTGQTSVRAVGEIKYIPIKVTLNLKQERRWNAEQHSAFLDPKIPTWLTTWPANNRPANFWKSKCLMVQLDATMWQYLHHCAPLFALHGNDFFFYIERKLWKVVQSQVGLMRINFKFEAPILQVQIIIYIIYYYSTVEMLIYFHSSMSLKTR